MKPRPSPFMEQVRAQMGREAVLMKLSENLIKAHEALLEKLDDVNQTIYKKVGPVGPAPTPEELVAIIRPLVPRISRDVLLELIKPLIPKVQNGQAPSKEELLAIIKPLLPKSITADQVQAMVRMIVQNDRVILMAQINQRFEELKNKKVKAADIEGLEDLIRRLVGNSQHGLHRGGGGISSLVAGTNVTIIEISSGIFQISATGGSGGSTVESPSGTIDGSNTIFTVTHAPSYIVVDGITKFETVHYTYSVGTITITDGAPPVQYIRSFY